MLEIEQLVDIDKTIDQLFLIYQSEGRSDLFEEMCPYFGTLWPAGRILTQFLSESPPQISTSARILEVGCGLAVPSLYLAKKGLRVEATDVHPDVPAFLQRNRFLNGVSQPDFVALDWRESRPVLRTWDVILASDVLYDKTQPESLIRFLRVALAPGGRAFIADPGRSYLQVFFDDAAQQGFKIKTHGLFGVLIGELTRDVVS